MQVLKAIISSDNQLIVTCGADLFLNVWKFASTEQPLARLFLHSTVSHLRLSSDARSLALISNRRNEHPQFMMFRIKNASDVMEK